MKLNRRSAIALIFVLLVIPILITYVQGLGYGFVAWDDNYHLLENPSLRPFSWNGIIDLWQNSTFSMYIPFTYSVWAFLLKFSNMLFRPEDLLAGEAMICKAFNLILHLTNSTLVFFLIKKILVKFKGPGEKTWQGLPHEVWASLGGALLFALHPLQVEVVTWVSGLKDLLCSFFALLGLWQYLISVEKSLQSDSRESLWNWSTGGKNFLLATLFFVFSLLSKPTVAVLPLMIWVLDVQLFKRSWKGPATSMLLWMFLALPIILITKSLQPSSYLPYIPPFFHRTLIAGDSLAFYIGKIFYPFPLMIDYAHTPKAVMGQSWGHWTWIIPTIIGGLLFKLRKSEPLLVVGGLLFALWLLPVLGIIPFSYQLHSTVADRYAYLSLLGIGLCLSVLILRFWNRPMWGLVTTSLLLLGGVSFTQVKVWKDSPTLFGHNLKHNNESAVAHLNYGVEMMKLGRMDLAFQHNQRALEADPHYAKAHENMGALYFVRGELILAEHHYRQFYKLMPDNANAPMHLGSVLADQGKLEEGLVHLQKALVLSTSKAMVYSLMGKAYGLHNRLQEGVLLYKMSLELNPMNPDALLNIGTTYSKMGEDSLAMNSFQQALKLNPRFPEAYFNLGNVHFRRGQFEEAIKLYQKAISLSPGMAGAQNNLKLAESQLADKGKRESRAKNLN